MADIQAYLDAIENAIYGEDVRGSIHDAIEIINEVGEVVITAGTAVTSASSSTEGFFENSLYFNTNTNDLWQCNGSGWTLLGNLKGDQGDQGNPGQAATIVVGTVTKGENASVVNSGTSSAAVFDFVLPKGDPGPAGANSWGDIDGDINDQTDLKNALEDVYAQSEELVDRTVGWVCNNLFDIEAVEMGKDIYGEAAANSALFTLNCKPSTRYYLSVHGTNNLQVSYNTTALGPTEVLIASFPYDFLTTQYDTYIKICFTKSGLTKSDIEALQFMLSEVANAPYSEHHPTVEEELADKAPISLLKDTVGWVGKNKLKVPSSVVTITKNGATFTVTRNADGEVTEIDVDTSGNATSGVADLVIPTNLKAGSYIINGCPANGGDDTYRADLRDYAGTGWTSAGVIITKGADVPFTLSADTGVSYYIRIGSGQTLSHKKFYPMIRDASITDSTFEPYHPPVSDVITDVYGVMGENGAKNYAAVRATNETLDTVVFTSNGDGTYTVNGSKTAAGHSDYAIDFPIKAGRYKINGCPDGGQAGGTDKFALVLRKSDYTLYTDINGNGIVIYDSSEREFIVPSDTTLKITLQVWYGYTASSLIFKPMIWDARDTNPDFVPYAMTNRELTDAVTPVESACTDIIEGASVMTTENGGNVLQKVGKIVFCHLTLSNVTATAWNSTIAKVPEGYKPKYDIRVASYADGKVMKFGPDGILQTSVSLTNAKIGISTSWITN